MAHRGLPGFGDNTARSLTAAAAAGADLLEIDVRISRDGVLVASHDPEAGGLKISETGFEELSKGGVEAVEDIVEALGSGALYMLDIKVVEAVEELERLIEDRGLGERALLAGDPEAVGILKSRTGMIAAPSFGLCSWAESLTRTLNMGAEILNENHRCYDRSVHEEAARRGLMVSVWTVNRPEEIGFYIERGVEFIVTDNVAGAVDMASRLGLRSPASRSPSPRSRRP